MLWQWERSGLGRVLVVGSMVRSFVRPLVRSFGRSSVFARRKNYIRKPLRELAHNSR